METPKKPKTARDRHIEEMTNVFFETLRKRKEAGASFNNNPEGNGSRGKNHGHARDGSKIQRNGRF